MKETLSKGKPELISEWSERNNFTPDKFTLGSRKNVWWKGSCGHEWQTTIKKRAYGSGCPYCACRKLLKGFNDLACNKPELVEEWSDRNYPLKPDMIMKRSDRKVWWTGICGHEWMARVADRYKGVGCPYCAGRILAGFNDLKTTRPALMDEWSKNNTVDPSKLSERSRQVVLWICRDCGYEWSASIRTRCSGGGECPACREEMAKQLYLDWLEDCREKRKQRRLFMKRSLIYYMGISSVLYKEEYDPDTGIPVSIYLPEKKAAIEISTKRDDRSKEKVKNRIYRRRGIIVLRILEPGTIKYDNGFCINKKEYTYDSDEEVIKKVFKILGIDSDVNIRRDIDEIQMVTIK